MNGKRSFLGGAPLIAFAVLTTIITVFTTRASAIPAFARKYKTSCATCHVSPPRLTAVGEAFRLNGYKFQDDELYIKDEPVELGDEAYKKVWPKALWPTDIPGLPPLAIIFDSKLVLNVGGEGDARSEFLFPNQAKLLGAGSMGDDISFFFELGFVRGIEQGHGAHHSESAGGTITEVEGWLQFEDLLRVENAFNLRVGTVGMQEMGLFMARNHNRLSVNPYLYSSWTMPAAHGDDFAAGLGMVADPEPELEGNPFMLHAQPGIEVNGFGRSWRYAVGVVNGNGDEFRDNNSEKDIYYQVAYKVGGLGFDGSGGRDDDKLSDSESWRDDSIILSSFGYYGTARIDIEGEDAGGDEVTFTDEDRFWRLGIGIQGKRKDLTVRGGYVYGRNEGPYGAITDQEVISHSWFGEAEYVVFPWLIPFVRYEGLALDMPNGVEGVPTKHDVQRFIVGTVVQIRANITLTVEGRFHTVDQRGSETDDDDQVAASLRVSF